MVKDHILQWDAIYGTCGLTVIPHDTCGKGSPTTMGCNLISAHLTGLVQEWYQSSEAGHDGFQEVHILLSPVERLLQHLEGLGHQQAHLLGLLADDPQHQEGAGLQCRVVVECSPKTTQAPQT